MHTSPTANGNQDASRPYFFFPSWWVKAFHASGRAKDVGSLRQDPSLLNHGLLPHFAPRDLSYLALLLSRAQGGVLSGDAQTWRFPVELLLRDSGAQGKSALESFYHFLGRLGGIRLLGSGESPLETLRLFDTERWLSKDNKTILEFAPADHTVEMVLGYRCGFREYCRMRSDRQTLSDVAATCEPLLTPKALWLELAVPEQRAQLQLEQEAQWGKRWVHPSGVMAAGLEDAVGFMIAARTKPVANRLQKGFESLKRFGKKLETHGRIVPVAEQDFYAFEEDNLGGEVLWQSDPSINAAGLRNQYQIDVGSYFCQQAFENKSWKNLFAHSDSLTELDSRFIELVKMTKLLRPQEQSIRLQGNLLVPTFLLYWEFLSRSQVGHPVRLPDSILMSPAMEVVNCGGSLDDFFELVVKDPILLLCLRTEVGGSLMSALSGNKLLINRWISAEPLSLEIEKKHEVPSRTAEENHKADVVTKKRVKHSSEKDKESFKLKTKPSLGMRSAVMGELEKIKAQNDASYESLVDSFLESLDDASKKMFKEMKGSVSNAYYQRLLQPRLVSFMMEKPNMWRSPIADH